jgi:hypothetical protein
LHFKSGKITHGNLSFVVILADTYWGLESSFPARKYGSLSASV